MESLRTSALILRPERRCSRTKFWRRTVCDEKVAGRVKIGRNLTIWSVAIGKNEGRGPAISCWSRHLVNAIYTSDLKRAHTTAQQIHEQNLSTPKPPFTVSDVLREQYFGAAEGQPWNAGAFNSAHLPWDEHRTFRLADEAESLADVGTRADLAMRHFIVPHLIASAAIEGEIGHHVVLVAHGIFLSEMMFALKRAVDPNVKHVKDFSYVNTGWSRVELEALGPFPSSSASDTSSSTTTTTTTDLPIPVITSGNYSYTFVPPARHELLPPPLPPVSSVPAVRLKIVAINQAPHLVGLVRQPGGIGREAHDASQKSLKEFFG
ncbi:fructose-2,6-bisphosphatase [Pseudohyphozyma bogoriensis]|nr:fructose-2,6-bisphosphatase [Pseudohyphozyma bogoriensis]